MVKKFGLIFFLLILATVSKAQPANCVLQPPLIVINFGAGNSNDLTTGDLASYRRVADACPSDGYYSFVPSTSGCFHDDWHTLTEDHTVGDINGNMLLVNAGYEGGIFLRTPLAGLKSSTEYELALWLMNLCRPTKKCPTLLLPNLNIRVQTSEGKTIANIFSGDVPRVELPWWTQYRARFITPAATSKLMLVMTDNRPGGCGNDFALDDITLRECVKQVSPATDAKAVVKTNQSVQIKRAVKKVQAIKKPPVAEVIKPETDTGSKTVSLVKQNRKVIASTPSVLTTRENALVRNIETEAGDIKIDVYDNGEIDGDSVSIYHNSALIKSHMRLSEKAISFTITVSASQPHHEIIMVAENLGSIPPNTSLMIVTTPSNRYRVFISSNEQKNAKVVFDLKK